eukprot:365995-Chlamydomonas_euryale.AAC.5
MATPARLTPRGTNSALLLKLPVERDRACAAAMHQLCVEHVLDHLHTIRECLHVVIVGVQHHLRCRGSRTP